jgi:ABC-type multidrug transport system permease subunit
MRSSWLRLMVLLALTVGLMLLVSGNAEAQCSMCRAGLTSITNARFVRNFNIGVLVLLVPPATIFCSIFIALRRYKGR